MDLSADKQTVDGADGALIEVCVEYVAVLKEQRGADEETLCTAAATPAELYAELTARHGFTLRPERMRVAVNACFVPWHVSLRPNDRVVFVPPVSGG